MTSQQSSNTIPWVDFARFVGTYLVVLAHIQGWGAGPDGAVVFYYTISRVGVPIFFLISGYLLLSKSEDLTTFFKKRAARVIIPFLVWSILYDLLYSMPFEETGVTFEGILRMFIRILRGPRAGHLWFFYSLIGLYLLTPILRVFVSKANKPELYYYIALWFLAAPVLFIVEGLTHLKNGFEIYYTGGYVGYLLIGYYLGKLEFTPLMKRVAFAAFVLGFLFSFSVFYYNIPPVENELPFRSYPSLNIVLMSVGAFVLVRMIGEKVPNFILRVSGWISRSSFGIYLFHFMLADWITLAWKNLGFNPAVGNTLIVQPVVATVVFLLSWAVIYILSTLPVLRTIV
jgi:surface polysaccharide O-acyltransferase-like enzyme